MYIDNDDYADIGTIGFLVCRTNVLHGTERYRLQDTPPRTNQSYDDRLWGWCGSFNDISTQACGLAVVTRTLQNGRAQLRRIPADSAEEREALERLGYPELAE